MRRSGEGARGEVERRNEGEEEEKTGEEGRAGRGRVVEIGIFQLPIHSAK